MKLKIYRNWMLVVLTCYCFSSCENFLEVDAPNNKLITEKVFQSDETALSALTGIYNELFVAAFSNGHWSSVSFLNGLSADNLEILYTSNLPRLEFQQNEIFPNNQLNLDLWSSAYNMIYMTNAFLEGLSNSEEITPDLKLQLEGEVRFIRAFTYFYLVNLYGDVPLALTTNYQDNALISRNSEPEIYEQILLDLELAEELLSTDYRDGERTQVNKYAAKALLARVNLYLENWEKAEVLSSEVIGQSNYEILENHNEVFLANSKEAIWQISPIGRGTRSTQTNDGSLLIIDPVFWPFAESKLSDNLYSTFDVNDKRLSEWIGYSEQVDAYFSFKYKVWNSSEFPIVEYSMVLRFAEQYLIRAEARAKQQNISGAISDLDIIRKRSGLELIADRNPTISEEEVLTIIMEERRKELFTEWGHRWLDLKRTNRAEEALGDNNSFWQNTDVFYPIPSEERMKNPNLSQNDGY